MTVFDRAWFAAHQRSLCAALNLPILGQELRTALGIGLEGPVCAVLPHASIVRHGRSRQAEFYSGPVLARRLHANLFPLWSLLHWFDAHVANPFVPAFNLGFDTLTKYSDANPETSTFDGYIMTVSLDLSFSSIRTATANGGTDSSTDGFLDLASSATSNQFASLRRFTHLFDTSALTSAATISAATLSVWGIGKRNALGTPALVVVSSNPESNTGYVSFADYLTFGSTSYGSLAYASFTSTDSAYSDVTINSTGQAAISKTGITKFGTLLDWDQAASFGGTWVTSDESYFQYNFAENASGTSKAPKLVVTYTSAATAALTGTGVSTMVETDVVTGGKTIVITLTGTTWVP